MKNIQIEKLSGAYTIRRLTDANHFWRKNGFAVLREAAQERGIVLLAERRLA